MIEITFVCFGNNFYEFHSEGHADYNPGNDIVCSAVSALSYALLGTLENIGDLEVKKEIKDGDMLIQVNAKDKTVHALANTVFTTVFIGLMQLEVTYPEHVKVHMLTEESSLQKHGKIKTE